MKSVLKKVLLNLAPASLLLAFLIAGACKKPAEETQHAAVDSMNGDDSFVQIFDGETLNGWEGDTTYWRVEGGNLMGEVTPTTLLKSNTFIVWKGGTPADFELKVEFRIAEAGNSGIN